MLARTQVPAAPAWEAGAHDPAQNFLSGMQWYTVLSVQGALPLDHTSLKEHQMPCGVVLGLQWWDLDAVVTMLAAISLSKALTAVPCMVRRSSLEGP